MGLRFFPMNFHGCISFILSQNPNHALILQHLSINCVLTDTLRRINRYIESCRSSSIVHPRSHCMLFYLNSWPWGKILENKELQPRTWWRYIDHNFLSETGRRFFKQLIEPLNVFHPTIKFTVEWSEKEMNFLDANVRLRNRSLETYLRLQPTGTHQFLDSTSCHSYHSVRKTYPTTRPWALAGSVLVMERLINAATT